MIAIVLFTQVWPQYFIVMLIAGATISLGALYVYGALAKRQPVPSVVGATRQVTIRPSQPRFKAFAPLILGVLIVVITKMPSVADWLEQFGFRAAAWGYAPIRINILTSAGFFIVLTALVCYCSASRTRTRRRIWRPLPSAAARPYRRCWSGARPCI